MNSGQGFRGMERCIVEGDDESGLRFDHHSLGMGGIFSPGCPTIGSRVRIPEGDDLRPRLGIQNVGVLWRPLLG